MGARTSKPILKAQDVDRRLTPQEKEQTLRQFGVLAKTHDIESGRIPKDIFVGSYLKERLPKLSQHILDRLFDTLAYRGKDDLNYEEFKHSKVLLDHTPSEPITGDMDLYDLKMQSRTDKLDLLFQLMDLDFNGRISRKEMKRVLSSMMQDASVHEWAGEALHQMEPWSDAIATFAMAHFDRSRRDELNFRDFQSYARRDLTIQEYIKMLTPQEDEFPSIAMAKRLLQEKKEREEEETRLFGVWEPQVLDEERGEREEREEKEESGERKSQEEKENRL